MSSSSSSNQRLTLVAMIFAVAMMFIDQTIVSLAIPQLSERPLALRDRRAVDRQRLPAVARRTLPPRRQARRRPRPSAHGHDRRHRLRRLLRAVRRDADRRDRRGLDDLVPRRPGRVRGAPLPRRARDRRRRVPAARARPRAGRLLRHHRRADRGRAARRWLPHRVDLARDLLDQRPRRDRRAGPHRQGQAREERRARSRSTSAAPCFSAAPWASSSSACSRPASGAGPTCARSAHRRRRRCCSSPSSPSSCAQPTPLVQLRIFAQRAFTVDTPSCC